MPLALGWGTDGSWRPLSLLYLTSPPFSVSSLSSSEEASEIPLSPYQLPFPWEATGDRGKVPRVMKQNLHHPGNNCPSWLKIKHHVLAPRCV